MTLISHSQENEPRKDEFCFLKFYKGEDECPERFKGTEKQRLWEYECVWSEMDKENSPILKSYMEVYISAGLIDFESNDNVLTSIKALLFNRFSKPYWSHRNAVEDFKKWYIEIYQKGI